LDETAGDVVDFSITFQRVQHDEQTSFVIIQFIEPRAEVRLGGEDLS
jgi:hypothetical protein